MESSLLAISAAQDSESCKDALRDFSALLKTKKGQGLDKLPQGTVKTICGQLNTYIGSSDLIPVGLQCLATVMSTPARSGMMMRLEGGIKTLAHIIKRHINRSKISGAAVKLVLRACTNSPQTLIAVMKEKGFALSMLECFRSHLHDSTVVSSCLELCVLLTRYEKGARLLAGGLLVEISSQVMMVYVGHWEIYGLALKALKNVAKFEEPRAVLLRTSEVRTLLLGAAKVVARIPENSKLLKRAFRALWMLSPEHLSPLPEPEPDLLLPEDDVNADIPSAMDCLYERDCQLFPELLEAAIKDDDNVSSPDHNGQGTEFHAVRQLVDLSEKPISAEQYSSAARPFSSSLDAYHKGGASLTTDMMVHDLQRLVHPEKVRNVAIFDNLAGDVGPGNPGSGDRLCFESRFESGNLRAAAQVFDTEYDLWLATDVNEREEPGHRQWFYFAVSGAKPGVHYKFNLVNMVKKDSLVNSGLCPLLTQGISAAMRRRESNGEGELSLPSTMQWRRVGSSCCYYPSPYRSAPTGYTAKASSSSANAATTSSAKGKLARGSGKSGSSGKGLKASSSGAAGGSGSGPSPTDLLTTAQLVGRGLFCHTFTAEFDGPGWHYIAMCYPYTYNDLQEHLARVTLSFRGAPGEGMRSMVARRSLLCWTIHKHRCDLLTVTDFYSEESEPAGKEYVVITGRVHPGETNSSWVMKGVIDFLTSEHPTARSMRQLFIFKIVPCLNPDGVINGNYRCGLAGMDLNRTWDKPDRALNPTIFHTRALLQRLASTGRLALYCDLHGHSRREDAFFYGCDPPVATTSTTESKAPNLGPQREEAERTASREKDIRGEAEDPNFGASKALPARDVARLRVRMLPYIMSKLEQGVCFNKCAFKVAKSKQSTGRVVVCRNLRVAGSYTLETSLGGCSKTGLHFSGVDLMRLGQSLCEAIAELADVDEDQLLDEMAASIDFGKK